MWTSVSPCLTVDIDFSETACPAPVDDHPVKDDEPDTVNAAAPEPAYAPDYAPAPAPAYAPAYEAAPEPADAPTYEPAPAPPPSPPHNVTSPPPPWPPPPAPVKTPPGCCNPNKNPFGFSSTQCCDPDTLYVVAGKTCMSSWWCLKSSDRSKCNAALAKSKGDVCKVTTPYLTPRLSQTPQNTG